MSDNEILDLIQKARETKATRLNLSNHNLAELPAEIGSLAELQVLWLHDNQLKHLPPEIGRLTKLRRLRLHNNQLEALPAGIGHLVELRRLTLHKNQLTALPPELWQLHKLQRLITAGNEINEIPPEIGNLTELRVLNYGGYFQIGRERQNWWGGNKLTALPPEIEKLTALQSLDVRSNQLTALPPEIEKLTALQSLDVRSNQLTALPPEIEKLTALQSLDVSRNQLTALPPEIEKLTALQSLDVGGNQLTALPPEIEKLTALQSLYVSGNQLTALPPEIEKLTALQSLSVGGNQLTALPPEIEKLTALQSLSVYNNQLTALPPEIEKLTALQSLDVGGNQLTALPPEIEKLTALQSLSVYNNQLTALPPEIEKLTALQSLDVYNNQLTALPPEIEKLTALQSLDVSNNQLTALPPEIEKLTALQSLYVSGNQLTALPPEIEKLTALQSLSVSDNQLTALPPEIEKLTALQSLYVSNNQLTALPPEIEKLTALQSLYVSGNQLTALPPEIEKLTALQSLYVDNNQLTALPAAIAQLTNLQKLRLANNQLTEVPREFAQLANLQELTLEDNPKLKFPSPEIVEQGWKAIRAYLSEDLDRVWVTKLLVVGQGGVGKSSLLRMLRGEPFKEGLDTTSGMDIGVLPLGHPHKPEIEMRLNTWDFAGQEINHATHQFFLTNRSLYLVVWNARHGFDQGRLSYWLDTVKVRAPEAKIILVATHTDQRVADLPFAELKQNYPQITEQYSLSNKTGEGAEELRQAIAEVAADLPLMGEYWPVKWLKVTEAIREMAKKADHITPNQLRELMDEHGIADDNHKVVLSKWLHELGEILFFRDVEELKNTVILKAQWVTKVISRVLESDEVRNNQAIFTRKHMEKLWNEIEPWMREHLLQLMDQFDLSYQVSEEEGKGIDNDRDKSLVVELLPLDEADYKAEWDRIGKEENCKTISMKFDLQSSMPAGIPTWFIARSHRFTTRTHWRYGAMFADGLDHKHLALIRALTQNNSLELIVRGPAPYNFFPKLRDGLELTLRRFPGLEIERTMPCPGHDGKLCSHWFPLTVLEEAVNDDPPEIQCYKTRKLVSVPEMLFGVQFRMKNDLLFEQNQKILAAVERVEGGMEEMREYIQREFTKLFNSEQSKEETYCPNLFILRGDTGEEGLTGLLEPIRSPGMFEKIRETVWKRQIELQLYCQEPGCWHPLGYERGRSDPETGLYQIEVSSDFLKTVAPYLVKLVKVLKYAQPVAGPFVSWADPARYEKQFKDDIERMQKLTEGMSKSLSSIEESREAKLAGTLGGDDDPQRASGATLRALRLLLEEKDKQRTWGRLRRLMTKEGHWLWLCPHHFAGYRD